MSRIPKVILEIETSRQYGRGLLLGIAKYVRVHGPWSFCREQGGAERALATLRKWGADGIIVRSSEKVEEIVKTGAAVILAVHRRSTERVLEAANIVCDNVSIGRLAAEHLLGRGFKRFGYCGFSDIWWSCRRCESFASRIEEAGLESDRYEQKMLRSPLSRLDEQKAIAEWLRSLSRPVGIMACNDDRGQEVAEACKIAELRVPEDVAIIGVDNDLLVCELTEPPLSSVALDTEAAGYKAAELLDKLMLGGQVRDERIVVRPRRVVMRQSTDVLAVGDKDVLAAVRYIRENSDKIIQVSDVVEHVGISRSRLYQKFQKLLGHSMLSEIRRARVDRITKRLIETDESVKEIAHELGYSTTDHISRYFRREKGMSPVAYRKSYSRP